MSKKYIRTIINGISTSYSVYGMKTEDEFRDYVHNMTDQFIETYKLFGRIRKNSFNVFHFDHEKSVQVFCTLCEKKELKVTFEFMIKTKGKHKHTKLITSFIACDLKH